MSSDNDEGKDDSNGIRLTEDELNDLEEALNEEDFKLIKHLAG